MLHKILFKIQTLHIHFIVPVRSKTNMPVYISCKIEYKGGFRYPPHMCGWGNPLIYGQLYIYCPFVPSIELQWRIINSTSSAVKVM